MADRGRRAWGRLAVESRDFRAALKISLTVIYALILREARTRYGRRSAGYVWALVMPGVQLMILVTLFSALGRPSAAGESLTVFFLTGILPLMLFRNGLIRGANAIRANRGLMLYPQVRAFEIVTARTVLEIVTVALVLVAFMLLAHVFIDLPFTAWLERPWQAVCAFLTLVLLTYGGATFSAQMGRILPLWSDLMSFSGRVLFFTSGVWYTFGSVQPGPRELMIYNPIAHVIEWIRDAVITGFSSDYYDPVYPLAWGVSLLALGLFIEWMVRISGFQDE